MREILFRGKHPITNQWFVGRYNNVNQTPYIITTGEYGDQCHLADPSSVGQFTGFVDCEGVKIFEGDYLALKDRICVVCWNENVGCWGLNFIRYTNNLDCNRFDFVAKELGRPMFWKNYKVIGNQIDHPKVEDIVDFTFIPNTLKLLEQTKKDLEYALQYTNYAIARGEIGEASNCVSLAGNARKGTTDAKEKLDKIWGSEKSKKD